MSHRSSPITRIVIVGAGGQGRVVADILLSAATTDAVEIVGFTDDSVTPDQSILDRPVLGRLDTLSRHPHDAVVVALGDNSVRERLTNTLEQRGERLVAARHPDASIGRDVTIGAGAMISAGVVITPCVRIGRGAIVNTRASIDHESAIGNFSHVAAGAIVGARVSVGDRSLIGMGATVISGRTVGRDAIVGAGAVVTRDVPDGAVVVGVPARIRLSRP